MEHGRLLSVKSRRDADVRQRSARAGGELWRILFFWTSRTRWCDRAQRCENFTAVIKYAANETKYNTGWLRIAGSRDLANVLGIHLVCVHFGSQPIVSRLVNDTYNRENRICTMHCLWMRSLYQNLAKKTPLSQTYYYSASAAAASPYDNLTLGCSRI